MRTPLRLCVAFSATVLTTLAFAGAALAAPPANDDFANPELISALAPYNGSNVDSTTETSTSPTEAQQLQSLTGWGIFNTTWLEWEAPGPGDVRFVVCSTFPTNVILTTGSTIPGLVLPPMTIGNANRQGTTLAGAAHPSGCAASEYVAELGTASVEAGTIIRPSIGSAFSGNTGTYSISTIFTDAPINDDFADRVELFSRHTSPGNNEAATTEASETNNPYTNFRTVWYEYKALGTNTVDIELCSEFAANLVAYSGTTLPLTPVQSAQGNTINTCGIGKYLTLLSSVPVTSGDVLKIQVGGFNGHDFVGNFDVTAKYNGIPPNDNWDNATDLGSGSAALVFGDNTHSTPGDPEIAGDDAQASVWYKWTAPVDTTVVLDACAGNASSYDGHLAVFDESTTPPVVASDIAQLATDDNSCTGDRESMPQLAFNATAGETYWIAFSLNPTLPTALYTEFTLVLATSPTNITLPSIDGADNLVGTEYTIDPGAWAGYSPISFSYQWQRCDNAGDNCTDISGETGLNYTLAAADDGNTIRAVVTASNLGGSTQETTGTSAVIEGGTDTDGDGYADNVDDCPDNDNESPKTNGCPVEEITAGNNPTISGSAEYGQTLTTDNGTWSTPGIDPNVSDLTFTYQWRRCNDALAGDCTFISGAEDATYVVAEADVGKYLTVTVKAENEDDIVNISANVVGPVPDPPDSDGDGVFDPFDECVNNIQGVGKTNGCPIEEISIEDGPTISGAQTTGTQLSVTSLGLAVNDPDVDTGVGAPAVFELLWRSCSSPTVVGTCQPRTGIGSGLASKYTITAADLGRFIRVEVVWTNGEGADKSGWSTAGAAVTDPSNPLPPTPPAPPAPTDPLKLAVKKSLGTVKRDKKGFVTFKGATVTCGATATGPCTVTIALTSIVGKKKAKQGNVKIFIAHSTNSAVSFKVSPKLAKAIKKAKGKKLKVSMAFTANAPGFPAQKATATATLK